MMDRESPGTSYYRNPESWDRKDLKITFADGNAKMVDIMGNGKELTNVRIIEANFVGHEMLLEQL